MGKEKIFKTHITATLYRDFICNDYTFVLGGKPLFAVNKITGEPIQVKKIMISEEVLTGARHCGDGRFLVKEYDQFDSEENNFRWQCETKETTTKND